MSVEYDKYYLTENLFGEPYPELIDFYSSRKNKGSLLDLGCGQGRDAIPLAKMGYDVVGIDYSKVGIDQLNEIAKKENLTLNGFVEDIYAYSKFDKYDFILLDSMFHFTKKDRQKEIELLSRIFKESKTHAIITICIQKTGEKPKILKDLISKIKDISVIYQSEFLYIFEDKESDHRSKTEYEMICLKKVN